MSVLKPRNRLINFRLTEEEFTALRDACRQQGARSISDFARSAVMAQAEHPAGPAAPSRVDEMIERLETRLNQLFELIEARTSDQKA